MFLTRACIAALLAHSTFAMEDNVENADPWTTLLTHENVRKWLAGFGQIKDDVTNEINILETEWITTIGHLGLLDADDWAKLFPEQCYLCIENPANCRFKHDNGGCETAGEEKTYKICEECAIEKRDDLDRNNIPMNCICGKEIIAANGYDRKL